GQAGVVAHHKVAVDFLNQVQSDADDDQQAGAAVKAGNAVVHFQQVGDDAGDDGHHGQEGGTDVGNAHEEPLKVIGGALAGPIAGNETAIVLEIIRRVLGVERDGGPEIAEEINQDDVEHVVDVALPLEDVIKGVRPAPTGDARQGVEKEER